MIVRLTPEIFWPSLQEPDRLHIVFHYGETCGPCKVTRQAYQDLVQHFYDHGIRKVLFYDFHQWQPEYKPFIQEHNLKVPGVPTFRAYFMGELLWERTAGFTDANLLKAEIVPLIESLQKTMGFSII